MDIFEKKYGIKENRKVKSYHRSRRMFCIYKNKLFIAEPGVEYSHAVWFRKKGWISEENDKLMDEIVRGIVDPEGNIYFYVGRDFRVNNEVEKIFFNFLKELIEILNLDLNCKIYGGLIKGKPGEIWPPKKEYGKIKDYIV